MAASAAPVVSDDEPALVAAVAAGDRRDALSQLYGRYEGREVLELGYHRGLKQAEIAERLGVPLGTVKTRTYHALRALKAALEERGGLDYA